jgi:hypothetical protein
MKLRKNVRNKQYQINFRPIATLLIGLAFFSVVIFVTIMEASGGNRSTGNLIKNPAATITPKENTPIENGGNTILAIVKELDNVKQQVTLFDVDNQETIYLTFSGGSDIKDKYDQIISASQIKTGEMVDAVYQKETNKLIKMQISKRAWEYIGVSNLSINESSKIMKIADKKYKYTDEISILNGTEFTSVSELAVQDELTIRGYDEIIWSITVTRGHGTVTLEDYEAFLGDNLTIGYESMQQITEGLVVTVREGNFNLTVENGMFSATKNITVNRNQETVVSLSDLGPDLRVGNVTFEITPFGADLYIDGEITSYANSVELLYGKHKIEVSLGGYTTYQGTLDLNSAGKTLKIDLPEVNSGKSVDIIETQNPGTMNPGNQNSESGASNEDNGNDSNTPDMTPEEDPIVDRAHLIYVQKPVGASVYMDGTFMGIAPVSFEKVIGSRVITLILEGYETKSYTVDILDDKLDTYFSLPDLVKKE